MNATTILCILLLSLYLVLAVFWIVRSIIDTIDDRKREKRNAALETEREARNAKWEAERQQLERERAIREVEFHEARRNSNRSNLRPAGGGSNPATLSGYGKDRCI